MEKQTNPHSLEFLLHASLDLKFAIDFAQAAGEYMVKARSDALISHKLDATVVTDVDTSINRQFIEAVRKHTNGSASTRGEEESLQVSGSQDCWVIDPLDGTREYIDLSIESPKRSSCIGIALLRTDILQLSVVYNPFKNETFVAERSLGVFLNGNRLMDLSSTLGYVNFSPGIAFDYAYWKGAPADARFFKDILKSPSRGSYSAISQACDVARGASAFAVFPGNTIHDIAPGALLVEIAGGVVSDVSGKPLNWNSLNGAVYAVNPHVHASVIQQLKAHSA